MEALKNAGAILKDSARGLIDDRAPMMGAALAYYTAFSIAPLLVVVIFLIGLVFGGGGDQVFVTIQDLVGPNGAGAIKSMVQAAASQKHVGVISLALAAVTIAVGASGVFAQLQDSLNIIWKVEAEPDTALWQLARQRLLSFSLIAVIAFLLIVSLVVSAAISAAAVFLHGKVPGGPVLWQALDFVVSLGFVSFLFSAIFKLLPDVKLAWRDVVIGGVFTGFLFAIGKHLIGLYLGKSGVSSAYGAAGSLIVVLLWVFYSSQIVLFGAEFTRALAAHSGRWPEPKPGARDVRREQEKQPSPPPRRRHARRKNWLLEARERQRASHSP